MKNVQIKIGKSNDNPFYGLRYCLQLFQNGGKESFSTSLLNNAWEEVKNNADKRKMFFSLLFSIGDITARKHNIFHNNKVDSGGTAARANFATIMAWLRKVNYVQFVKFMFAHLFNEFTSFDNLLGMRIKTQPKTNKVLEQINMTEGNKDLAKYIAQIIQSGTPFDKFLVAKFLTRPRLSKRSKHKVLLLETKAMMIRKQALIKKVSDIVGFSYEVKNKYINFTGFYAWKKQFNGELESVLFSSGKIKEFDESGFKLWLDKLPSSARHRVRVRVLSKDNVIKTKWGDLGKWFLSWENYKEVKQKEVRIVEEKIRQGTATDDEKVTLVQTKKEAKVTTGAIKFDELFKELILNTADILKIQPFLDKINLPYNNLVFADDSGSMTSSFYGNQYGFTPFDFAAFMATIFTMKNPDDVGRSLLGLFSDHARFFTHIDSVSKAPNSILNGVAKNVSKPFYDPNLNFKDNLTNMRSFLQSKRTGYGTNISSIPEDMHRWTKGDSALIEQIQQFPVWTIISDGNWNNLPSPESSMNDFMRKCELYFGFKPFIVAIDVAGSSSVNSERFSGIENFMFLPANPAQIEQFLVNFKDMDIMDIYTPLLSLFRSNRYEIVRSNTL